MFFDVDATLFNLLYILVQDNSALSFLPCRNPYKGNIINQPNGTNVYPGVLKDYTKKVRKCAFACTYLIYIHACVFMSSSSDNKMIENDIYLEEYWTSLDVVLIFTTVF